MLLACAKLSTHQLNKEDPMKSIKSLRTLFVALVLMSVPGINTGQERSVTSVESKSDALANSISTVKYSYLKSKVPRPQGQADAWHSLDRRQQRQVLNLLRKIIARILNT